MVRQNIIFVENRPGSLKKVTGLLKENNMTIYGYACFDAPEFAVFRMICQDPDKAERIMTEAGYMNRVTPVLVVDASDEAKGLDAILSVLSDRNVNLNYVYTSHYRGTLSPVVVVYSEDLSVTESILQSSGFKTLDGVEELGR